MSKQVYIQRVSEVMEYTLDHIESREDKVWVLKKFKRALETNNLAALKLLTGLKRPPVNIETFVRSKDFLDNNHIFPKVMEYLNEMSTGEYSELVFTGGIGTAKTHMVLHIMAYHLYLLSCYHCPQYVFGLDPASEMLLVFQAVNLTVAKKALFAKFKAIMERSPYFKNEFTWDRKVESSLKFPHHIEVLPVAANDTSIIGQDVICGAIDEINFMDVVADSKKQIGGQGEYDQAKELFSTMQNRINSRFSPALRKSKIFPPPGILCIMASANYPGQMTDQRKEAAKRQIREKGYTNIYIYDEVAWNVMPWEGRYCGEFFNVFLGDEFRKPKLLPKGYEPTIDEKPYVKAIPIEYYEMFSDNIHKSIREIAGVTTLATHPFIPDTDKISAIFIDKYQSLLSAESTDFEDHKVRLLANRFYKPELPRWVHIDLSISGDSTGIVCGTITDFTGIKRGRETTETMPKLHIDFALEVFPPRGGEILYYKIRSLILKLSELGLNIKWISFDSFQSVDSIQILRQSGFVTGKLSLDKTTVPYDTLKTAIYDGRISCPNHEKLKKELTTLELDLKKGKVDHPSHGSKDISDSLAAVVYGLTMRTEIWVAHGIPIYSVPPSIKEIAVRNSTRMQGQSTELEPIA